VSSRLFLALIATAFLAPRAPLCAQDSASVRWDLLSNGNVSGTVGSVTGRAEALSYSPSDSSLNLQVRDYSAVGGGQRLNLGPRTWPYETVENSGRYVQFAAAPVAGLVLHVSAVSLDLGAGGTSAMNANVYCSTDSSFASRTKLNSNTALPNGAWLSPSPSYSVSYDVPAGEVFWVRIYPWYNINNPSTSKYLYIRSVVISGVTHAEGSPSLPTVTTAPVTEITATSAKSGGNVTWDGGASVAERGVCWDTASAPTIAGVKTSDGAGTGTFSSVLTGLTEGGHYHIRAYATNAVGTAYGIEETFTAANPPPQQLAFPTAEGYGKYTKGGRGGAVIEVTNLDDSGTGSLRAAVQAGGPRTVVFRVSGTIILNSNLTISNPYITIAGQTAPGDGICIRRYPLVIATDQVIIRYLRVRLGDESGGESDAMSARWQSKIIVDHCSASWSEDETLSFYWCDSLTVQWCLISESLYNSNHPKGAHGYGGIWGGENSTYHHNLLAHHSSRNPRFAASSGNTDHRNNVIYNWGFNSAYGGEAYDTSWQGAMSTVNMVANYYKAGPATKSGVVYRIVNPSTTGTTANYGLWFVANNFVYGYPNVTADNWTLGVQGPADSVKARIRSAVSFSYCPIEGQTAEEAYVSVLSEVGANRPKRDSIDLRILGEVQSGTATYEGATYRIVQGFPSSAPTTGIIDSQTDVGGWPVLNTLPAPPDSDHDGMPDTWESAHGLNPIDPLDRNGIGEGGYTNLEVYLNSPDLLSAVRGPFVPSILALYPNFPNPFNPTTTLEFTLSKGGPATLKVYNILGQLVGELFHGIAEGQRVHRITFDARGLASGVYVSVLEAEGRTLTRKMVLAR
jgi:pectate lyase